MKLGDATPVLLRTKQSISSANANVGSRIPFRGRQGRRSDRHSSRRGSLGRGDRRSTQGAQGGVGSFQVAIQTTQLLTGESAPLRAEQQVKGAGRSMGADVGQAVAESGGLALPFLPLVMPEKGQDAYLPADVKVTAYLNVDVPGDRTAFERVQPLVVHPTGPATITIFSEDTSSGDLNSLSVYCGRIALVRMWNGQYFRIQLSPGKYFFLSNDHQALALNLEEGQEIYVQMQLVIHGWTMKGHLVQVSNAEGEDEVASLLEMKAKDVVKISAASLTDLQATLEKK